MEKTKTNPVRILAEIGVMAALGLVIDELQSAFSRPLFAAGGSIGFAMVCVIVVAYRRGFLAALATGVVMSALDVVTGPSLLPGTWWRVFAQLLLDYLLAYPVVAIAGFFKKPFDKAPTAKAKVMWIVVGCLVGGFAKFLIHYLAGVIFWNDPEYFVWGLEWMNAYLYSLIYNGAYMLPCIILTTLIALVLFWRVPSIYQEPMAIYRSIKEEK